MNIVKPDFTIISSTYPREIMRNLEFAGRLCYKSECNISDSSADKFIRSIITRGHESVIEHEKVSVWVMCDRGVSHEIVRHRLASYSQESTRYCNYSNEKFGSELTFIKPCFFEYMSDSYSTWLGAMEDVEKCYFKLLAQGAKPEEARSILPNSLKTELVMTMNLREWRHFFRLRTSDKAHPQMREIARPMLIEFHRRLPAIFFDFEKAIESFRADYE